MKPAEITPMLRVPDVKATIDWYVSIGFELTGEHEEDGVLNWAQLTFGDSAIMLDAGGNAAVGRESDVVLYIQPIKVDEFFTHLPRGVHIVQPPYDAFHGRRELIVKDNNGFTVVFAEPIRE